MEKIEWIRCPVCGNKTHQTRNYFTGADVFGNITRMDNLQNARAELAETHILYHAGRAGFNVA